MGFVMKRTPITLLAAIAFAAMLAGAGANAFVFAQTNTVIRIGIGSVASIALLTFSLALWGWFISERLPKSKQVDGKTVIQRSSNPLPPLVAARTVALSLAASRTGSFIAGIYGGLALVGAFTWSVASVRVPTVISVVTLILAVLLIVVAMWIERNCSLPENPEGVEGATD